MGGKLPVNAEFLRDNPLFWSQMGFCYDPPILDETGKPRVLNLDFGRDARRHDAFADAGVDIHTCILHAGWVGVDRYDYSLCDRTLDALFASGKVKYFIPRVKLNVPVDWCAKYPEDVWVYEKGPRDREGILALVGTPQHDWLGFDSPDGYDLQGGWLDPRPNLGDLISMQSFSSRQWLQDAGLALEKLIRHLEEGPYGHRIIGYQVAYGISGELMPWGRNNARKYGDFGINNQKNFLRWGLRKYGSMEALREAWGDFGDDVVPPQTVAEPAEFPVLTEKSSTWGRDYMRYHTEINTDALAHFSAIAKRTSGGKLVGAFYGYVMDVVRAAFAGHLGWERMLACPDIDFFAAPKSYRESGPGEPGGEMSPAVSVNLRKLWVDECDNRTHLALETDLHPAETPAQTYAIHWREWCKNVSHNSGLWYMDLGGGWFDDAGIMENIRLIVEANRRVRPIPHRSAAQILNVIHEESKLAIPRMNVREATTSLRNWQRAGVAIDSILLRDLFTLPLDGVKLVILSSPYALDEETLLRIRQVLPEGCRVVWQGQLPFTMTKPDEHDIVLPMTVPLEETRRLVEEAGVHTYAPAGCAVYADNRIVSFFPGEAMSFTADLGGEYEVYDAIGQHPLGKTRRLELELSAKSCAVFELR